MPEESPGRDELLRYIRENRERYTPEAIRAQLLAAGHPAHEVDAAFAEAQPLAASTPWGTTTQTGQFWAVYIGYIAILVVGFFLVSNSVGATQVLVLAMLGFGLFAALSSRFGQTVRRAIGCALTTVVVVPLVLVIGLYAYCLATQTING